MGFNKKGSCTIESALVYPLVILFLSLAISTAYKLDSDVYSVAKTNIENVEESLQEGNLSICNIIRGRWLLE